MVIFYDYNYQKIKDIYHALQLVVFLSSIILLNDLYAFFAFIYKDIYFLFLLLQINNIIKWCWYQYHLNFLSLILFFCFFFFKYHILLIIMHLSIHYVSFFKIKNILINTIHIDFEYFCFFAFFFYIYIILNTCGQLKCMFNFKFIINTCYFKKRSLLL